MRRSLGFELFLRHHCIGCNLLMKDQVDGPISTAQLNPSLDLHMRPINVVVFDGSHGDISS